MSVDRDRMTVRSPSGSEIHEYLGQRPNGVDSLCDRTIPAGRISRGKVSCKDCIRRRESLEMAAINAASAAKRGGEVRGPGVVVDLAKWRKTRGAA